MSFEKKWNIICKASDIAVPRWMWSPSWIIIASPPSKAEGLGAINETPQKKQRKVAFQPKNATDIHRNSIDICQKASFNVSKCPASRKFHSESRRICLIRTKLLRLHHHVSMALMKNLWHPGDMDRHRLLRIKKKWCKSKVSQNHSCLFVPAGDFFPPNSEWVGQFTDTRGRNARNYTSTSSLLCKNGRLSAICCHVALNFFPPIPFFPSPPLASAGGRIFVMGTWQEKTCRPFQHPLWVKS